MKTKWDIEWITEIPTLPDGSSDWDKAIYHYAEKKTKAEALVKAIMLLEKSESVTGEVHVREWTRNSEYEEWGSDNTHIVITQAKDGTITISNL
jgi:hypothetical protein